MADISLVRYYVLFLYNTPKPVFITFLKQTFYCAVH